MYLAIEGIDTAGKSTQLAQLLQHFPNALFTKEPGSTPFGSQLRHLLLNEPPQSAIAELLLFCADRAEHIDEVIAPNKEKLIISDRSLLSGIAYGSVGATLPFETIVQLNSIAIQQMPPQCAVLLELSEATLTERLSAKPNDAIELRGIPYLLNVQTEIKRAADALNIPLLCIDASQDIQEITQIIISYIKERL